MLAESAFDAPAILTADLDLGEITRGKYDLDVVGHYARPARYLLLARQHSIQRTCAFRGNTS
jgi:nitrilase